LPRAFIGLAYDVLAPWHRRHAIWRLRWLERRLPDAATRFAVPFVRVSAHRDRLDRCIVITRIGRS
jgi:hypothetical protein